MSVTEYERHQLFSWFEEHMGKERATTMMSLVPPVGWGDVATKRDLDLLRAETEIMRAEMEVTRVELRSEIASVRADFAAGFERHSRTFVGWLFASQAAVIGVMTVLLAIE